MTEYERDNALDRIDGYHLPHPGESERAAFDRAKEETIGNLRAQLSHVESITSDQFKARR